MRNAPTGSNSKWGGFILLWLPFLSLGQQKPWTLKECLQQAWQKNIVLNQSKWNNEITGINYQQARENRLPGLAVSDAQNFNFGKYNNPSSFQTVSQNFSTNSLLLSSSVILFNGFQYQNLVKQNRASYQAGMLDIEKAKNDLGLSVLAAYLQVAFEYEDTAIAQAQIDATTEQLSRIKKYVAIGQLAELNQLQVQAQLARDESAKTRAKNQLQLAKLALMQLMELPVTDSFNVAKTDISDLPADMIENSAAIYNNALALLPDAKSARIKTNASGYALSVSKGALYPKLTISGSLGTSYSSLNTINTAQTTDVIQPIGYLQGDPAQVVIGSVPITTTSSARYPFRDQYLDNFGQVAGLNLSVPIFNALLYRNNVRKAKIAVTLAQLNESAVKNQLRKAVEQADADRAAAARDLAAANDAWKAEDRAYKDMEKKFAQGAVNITDFLVEKTNYNKASLTLLEAKYTYIFRTWIINFYNTNSFAP